ncbi:tRNA pseudouridine(55) synthase TruB [Streptomyces sp. NPDC005438]|uniref:tRNA pseudouridine(55) synthase TruB n=1 Tax=Streptomyces sp. NPDC005438 TaxID=3156880 RepID=UPI0033BD86EB
MARKRDNGPGGLLIVDKPSGFTSHDIVAKVRGMARTRRVGHAGTLDPLATGVLVVGLERATRLLGHLALTEKEYVATVRLGQATVTDDAEGEVLATEPVAGVTRKRVEEAIARLTGEIKQVPSKVSAVKVDGKRSYARVREGEEVELAARTVTVSRFDLHAFHEESTDDGSPVVDLLVSVVCSSGTYVRALARDLGADLGVGGHLTALRRTRVGPYGLDAARGLEELQKGVDEARAEAEEGAPSERSGDRDQEWEPGRGMPVIPLGDAAAAAFPQWRVNAEHARLLGNGARIPMPEVGEGGPVAVFGPGGEFLALVERHDGRSKSLAVFV